MGAPKWYNQTFSIRSTDTDRWDRLQPDALFSMLQEAAGGNAERNGYGRKKLDPLNLVWMLAGVSLRMDRFPAYDEQIEIATWAFKLEKLYFHRNFLIRDTAGQVLGQANSIWFLVDYETRRPQRPSVIGESARSMIVDEPLLPFDTPNFRKEPFDRPVQPTLSLSAEFTDIDRNGHVNNTRYIAWSIDAFYRIHGIGQPWFIAGVDVNYISEVPYLGEVRIYAREAPDSRPPERPDGSSALHIEGTDEAGQTLFRTVLYYKAA